MGTSLAGVMITTGAGGAVEGDFDHTYTAKVEKITPYPSLEHRTTVSGVSDSGTSYTASLSFSPIANSDSGFYTATVTVRPTTTSQYIQHASTISTESVTVKGKIITNLLTDHEGLW